MKTNQQNKDKTLEHNEKRKISLNNNLKKYKKQLNDVYKMLKSENCKNIKLEKQIQTYE